MRLFVAAAPPPEAVDDLATAVAPLRNDALRWPDAETWHVTLAFYGELDESAFEQLDRGIEDIAGQYAPADLQLAGAGRFGREVLWAGLRGDVAPLRSLAASLNAERPETSVERATNVAPRRQRFHPHVTLARAKGGADLRPYVKRLERYAGPQWRMNEIVLFRSSLGAGAEGRPLYEPLRRYSLTGVRAGPPRQR